MTRQELTYWVALALMPGVWTRRKNELYAKCYVHSPRLSIVELFEQRSLWGELGLSSSEQELMEEAHIQLAMARNPIIYGMASEIYVAETGETGGTWAGAVDGLRKGRAVFVRWPEPEEDNANKLLAQRGARAVGMEGEPVSVPAEELKTREQREAEDIDRRILSVLKSVERASLREVLQRTGIGWSDAKMKRHLEGMPQVERTKATSRIFYSLRGRRQSDLFSKAGEPIA